MKETTKAAVELDNKLKIFYTEIDFTSFIIEAHQIAAHIATDL